jgi:hypothetical protein
LIAATASPTAPAWWARRPKAAFAAAGLAGLAIAYAVIGFDGPQGLIWSILTWRPNAALWAALSLGAGVPIAAAAAIWFYRSALTRKFVLTAGIVSVLFTVWTITGMSFNSHANACHWSNCAFGSAAHFTPGAAVGFLALYYAAVAALARLADKLPRVAVSPAGGGARAGATASGEAWIGGRAAAGGRARAGTTASGKSRVWAWARGLVAAHPLGVAAAVIAVAWLPYAVALFPGTYSWDGFRQLNEFYGHLDRTTHHPYLATALMGGLFSVGRGLGATWGLFGYTLAQSVAGCLVFAWTCGLVFRLARRRLTRPAWAFVGWGAALAFFALNPIFPVGANVVFKDYPYTLSVLVLVNVLVRAAAARSLDRRGLVAFAAGCFGAVAFRNDGIVVMAASAVCLALVLRRVGGRGARSERGLADERGGRRPGRAAVFVTAGAVAAVLVAANGLVFPALGVTKYSNAEMLSLPLQQTARFLKTHPADVTAAEAATLQSLLKDGNRVEDLGAKYKATLSDPVKNRFKSFDADSLRRYMGVWWSMFIRHPATYVEATVANIKGYFFPYHQTNAPPITYPDAIHRPDGRWEEMKAKLSKPGVGFDPDYPAGLAGARVAAITVAKAAVGAPVVWLAFCPALYTWMLVAAAALLMRRRRWLALAPFAPAALVFLVCLASPVDGNVRYALPYIVVAPVLIAWALRALAGANQRQEPRLHSPSGRPSAGPAEDRASWWHSRWPRRGQLP